ncbi:MAG: hypothetical protein GC206_15710 [Alphaproteobacteria bacterium]|nr:hypothetical protein [Alphaproteobacteria bacterium]
MSAFPYQFEAPIAHHAFETYAYIVVYMPAALAASSPFADRPRIRIIGEVADHPVAGAWQPARGGRRFFLLSKRFLRAAGLAVGDVVEMRFAIDESDAVDTPPEITAALRRNAAFRHAWTALTPGAQRAFAHRVSSAKASSTRERRLSEVIGMVLRGEKPGASKPKRKSKRPRP